MKGAADWIGSKVGGVEGDTSRGCTDSETSMLKVTDMRKGAEGDVSGFDNSMDQSYNQGEQQGRQ
ncbi:hypothetical protein LTR12_005732 [Friedmanniomyces endolithicus]|nr:hypothetical protein LTR12_005732 [Friedmanniomyces endolithicus]